MSLHRDFDGAEPLRTDQSGPVEMRPARRSQVVATGTFACPACDLPVLPAGGSVPVSAPVACPYCGFAAPARDFLSLGEPTRATHVDVRISLRGRR